MRPEFGKQGMVAVFQHDFAKEFEANAKGRGGCLAEIAALPHAFHHGKDIVVTADFKLQ